MTKSFSPYWDRLARRAVRENNPDLLRAGRAIEVMVMGLVLCPKRIQLYWDEGRFADLAFLAEYIAAGVPRDVAKTDPVLHRNLVKGLAGITRQGWDRRLKPGPLRIRAAAQRRRKAQAGEAL